MYNLQYAIESYLEKAASPQQRASSTKDNRDNIAHLSTFSALSNATNATLNPFQTSDLKKPMMNNKYKSNYRASVQFFILIKYNQQ